MATLPKIDAGSVGGMKSLTDLYTMLAGESTTTSGGTQTTTEGVDQGAMNAMLQSALANTNGLASISQGQRSAGGYGSSVNQMLTNDLLTRTAAQIAAQNKTTTTSRSPQTTVKGGITGEGVSKSIGFTAALQGLGELDKLTGLSKKYKDWTKSDETAALPTGQSATMSDASMADAYAQGSPSIGVYGVEPSASDTSYQPTDGGLDFADMSGIDDIGISADSFMDMPAMEEDPLQFLSDFGFADGGEVKKARPNVLGTSQFNKVVDSRAGKIGGGTGENKAMPTVDNETGVIQPGKNTSPASSGSSGGSSGSGGGADLGKFVNVLATDDGQKFSKALGVLGKLTSSPALQKAGIVGGVATAKDPALTGMLTAGNIITKGALGTGLNAIKTLKNPTVGNAVDFAANFNPMTAGINGILTTLGFRSLGDTAGDVKHNIDLRSSDRSHLSPEQQAAAEEWANGQAQQVGSNPEATPEPTPQDSAADDFVSSIVAAYPSSSSSSSSAWTDPSNSDNMPNAGDAGGMPGTDTGGGDDSSTMSAADGGYISGPGTGTSDSIPARLSDGETVITAATTKKAKEMFGEDFFLNLEAKFNAPAAIQQKLKGRA